MSRRNGILSCVVALATAAWLAMALGCERSEGGAAVGAEMAETSGTLKIESTAFKNGGRIPRRYTGDGANVSPPLAWSGVPDGTKELALICDDPDAPRAEPWVHWVLYGLPADCRELKEAMPRTERLAEPKGAMQGPNSSRRIGYSGPRPPKGHGVHHYHFKLYALDAALNLEPGLDKPTLLAAMKNHVLGMADLVGTYQR